MGSSCCFKASGLTGLELFAERDQTISYGVRELKTKFDFFLAFSFFPLSPPFFLFPYPSPISFSFFLFSLLPLGTPWLLLLHSELPLCSHSTPCNVRCPRAAGLCPVVYVGGTHVVISTFHPTWGFLGQHGEHKEHSLGNRPGFKPCPGLVFVRNYSTSLAKGGQ